MSYGAQTKFGIARQSAGGTAVSQPTSFHALAFLNHDIGLEKDELISQNLIGRFEQGAVFDGTARVRGSIEFECTPRNLGAILAAVVNYNPAVATSGSLKRYTFLPNTVDYDATYVKAPFTIYDQLTDANSAEQFYDCQFGQLDLTFSQGQFLKGKATVAAGVRTLNGVGSANIVPDAADVDNLFPWNVASVSLGGSAVSNYSDITVSLNENLDAIYTINGTLAPFKYTRTAPREVTANGTIYVNDRALLNSFAAGTLQRLLITAVDTSVAIQTGSYNYLSVDIPQFKLTQFKLTRQGPGEVAVNFTGRGTIDPSSAYAVQYILINTYGAGY
jgi:hypothetical protein